MSKRRGSPEHDRDCACTCAAKRVARAQPRQKHLYLALDDREKAYSLYKLDVDGAADQRRLPEPPVLRLEVPTRGDACVFAAVGSKIIVLSTNRSPTLVHDTHTTALAIGCCPPRALSCRSCLTVAAAGRLYALPPEVTEDMYYLEEEPPATSVDMGPYSSSDEEQATHRRSWRDKEAEKWTWRPTDSRSPVPFDPRDVTCHAVHPDGRTIFVSVQRRQATWMDHGTFSLDASRDDAEWTRHGDWLLPFEGQAFFDGQLNAWVGLDESGHMCACDGVSRRGSRAAAPARKVGKETLLREADPDRRLSAALAYMGGGCFCLVESAVREGVKPRHSLGYGGKCVVHVTTFGIRYDKHGDLTTTDRHLVGSYAVSRHHGSFSVQAFVV